MKNKTALGHLICMIASDCPEEMEQTTAIGEEEIHTENRVQGFQPFDLDAVFVN